jgi:hypothetical protein
MRELNKNIFEKLAKGFPMAKQAMNARFKFLQELFAALCLMSLVRSGMVFAQVHSLNNWHLLLRRILIQEEIKRIGFKLAWAHIEASHWKPSKKYNGRGIENKF